MSLNRANPTTSMKWRTQIRQNLLVFQVSSILLQRHNWVSLLQKLNLSSKLTPSIFNQILHKTQTNPQISLLFFNWVQTNLKLKPDLRSQCHIINICVNSGLTLPVRPIMDSLVKTHPVSVLGGAMIDSCRGKSLKSGALSFVLECYSHKGLFMESLEIFLKMRGNGFIASGTACNAILDVLQRENKIKLAWRFYCAMIKDGVLPDKLTWSLIAQILCKDGNFERIVKFLDMGVYNSVLYNGVIDRYSKIGDFEAAFERLNQMCERKLDPGFSTYSSILDGACKHGNEEVIERVMDIMAEKGLLPKCPLSQCDLVIQKFSDLCKMDVATMFFKRACDEKIGLQDATYGCMLKALSKEERVKEAIALYHSISEKGIRVKDSTYHAFLDLLCEDQYEEGYEILGDMMRRGFRPGTTGLSKFISLLSRKRRWREVEDLLDVVLEKGLLPDSSCCCSLVEHYCSRRQFDKAVALHNKMEKLQASLDVATYNILLAGLAKNGRIEEVVRVFEYMEGLKLLISRFLTSTNPPRPYSLLIFFDAEQFHSKPELHLQDLYTQYSLVSSSFIANNDVSASSSLFFCDIEFKESQNSFSLFGVNSLPHIRLVSPNVKNLQDSEVMDQGDFSLMAESMAEFVESRTKLNVGPIHRPPILSKNQITFLIVIVLIWVRFFIKNVATKDTILHDWRVWLLGAVFVYFFSVSGGMFNIIRKMPIFLVDRNDPSKLVFFHQGSGMQLGGEGFAVGFLYTTVGLLLSVVTHVLVRVNNRSAQQVVMGVALVVSFWAVKKVVSLDSWKTGYGVHAFWPTSWR
ncbi:hypothetical protein SADUNF_Sadunf04G0012100 [Salix dunnii]|uniref:PROP1-like PPR domain-containing protein n=1 Tax=Salix dunnii TaxID=1413687 RepID=A0A835N3U1_9ROSI|nr:hypothetical protein SADUNF_Sadunf04G0012100 [Salix dunnii]